MFQLLPSRKDVKLDRRDKDGSTPLLFAKKYYSDTVRLLEEEIERRRVLE